MYARRHFLLGLATFALGAAPAIARPRFRFRTGGGISGGASAPKTYGGDVLALQELENCVRAEQDIDRRDSELASSEFLQVEQRLQKLSRDIDFSKFAIDRSSQASIDAHNALIDEYNRVLEQMEPLQLAYNKSVESMNAIVDRFNVDCASKRYYEDDMITVTKRLGL